MPFCWRCLSLREEFVISSLKHNLLYVAMGYLRSAFISHLADHSYGARHRCSISASYNSSSSARVKILHLRKVLIYFTITFTDDPSFIMRPLCVELFDKGLLVGLTQWQLPRGSRMAPLRQIDVAAYPSRRSFCSSSYRSATTSLICTRTMFSSISVYIGIKKDITC